MAVRIGFIGAGGIAGAHIECLSKMKGRAQIVAVCDIKAERAQGAAKKTGAKPYTKWQEMLDKEELDAIYICIPPFAHGDIELAAAERKLPIFIEKPLGVHPEVVRKIASAIRSSGVIVSVGYHWRYSRATEKAVEFLESSGAKITCALGFWAEGMPTVEWWRRRDGSGGQVNEQATHIFDLMRYVLGKEPQQVHAYGAKGLLASRVENFDVEDSSCVAVKFADDTVGTIISSCALPVQYKVGLHILTDKGLVFVEMAANCTIQTPEATTIFKEPAGFSPMRCENEAFISAVETGDTSAIRSNYDDAAKTFAFTWAATESMRTGKPGSPEKL